MTDRVPVATKEAARVLGDAPGLSIVDSAAEALRGHDVLAIEHNHPRRQATHYFPDTAKTAFGFVRAIAGEQRPYRTAVGFR